MSDSVSKMFTFGLSESFSLANKTFREDTPEKNYNPRLYKIGSSCQIVNLVIRFSAKFFFFINTFFLKNPKTVLSMFKFRQIKYTKELILTQ